MIRPPAPIIARGGRRVPRTLDRQGGGRTAGIRLPLSTAYVRIITDAAHAADGGGRGTPASVAAAPGDLPGVGPAVPPLPPRRRRRLAPSRRAARRRRCRVPHPPRPRAQTQCFQPEPGDEDGAPGAAARPRRNRSERYGSGEQSSADLLERSSYPVVVAFGPSA